MKNRIGMQAVEGWSLRYLELKPVEVAEEEECEV